MAGFDVYESAYWALLVTLLTVVIQQIVASTVKAKQTGAIPGKPPEEDSHHSFVFRAYRTHLNSLENLPVLLGAGLLAILVGANATWTAIWLWLYAVSRMVHMVLYYAIATERNPSPRSYFFLLGLVSTLALLILIVVTLL